MHVLKTKVNLHAKFSFSYIKMASTKLLLTAFCALITLDLCVGSDEANTIKLLKYEPDCDKNAFRCFNYGGALSYNEVCYSDDEKRRVFMDYLDPMGDGTPKGGEDKTKVEKKLLQELDNNSCNTTRYLECRRISDKDSPGQLPQYRCACPDHEKGDSPDAVTKSESYFDKHSQMCVLKVGAKCTNLTIPDDDKRLNGSRRYLTKNMVNVVDGRRQWLTLPCVPNARCKIAQKKSGIVEDSDNDGFDDNSGFRIISGVPTKAIDPSKNRCTCLSGFIIEDGADGKCYPIDGTGVDALFKSRSSYPLGVLLFLVSFCVTFWAILSTN